MKRYSFIASLLTYSSIPFSTVSTMLNNHNTEPLKKGFKINADEGRIYGHIKMKGVNSNIMDLKISGKDTDGGMVMLEQTSISPGRGTPLHIHPMQDEVFFVLQGTYLFKVGEDTFHLQTGDSIFLPRNVAHAWAQTSEKGKMTVMFQPAGKMEEFFVAMQQLEHEPTHSELVQIFAEHEMRLVGPPLKVE